MADEKREARVMMVGKALLDKLTIERQHAVMVVLAKIIEQQDCESLMVLPKGCSVYDDADLEHFMMYEGFDYPDAHRLKAYVKCVMENNIS
jgi:hypothetical protein